MTNDATENHDAARGDGSRLSEGLGMLAELARVPPGAYCVDVKRPWWRWWQPEERGGWLTVEREKNGDISVMWTTDKDTHWPHGRWGCARSVTLGPDGALVAYFQSALSMWIKWGYGRGGDAELRRALDFAAWAHSRLCGMPNASMSGPQRPAQEIEDGTE